MFNILIVGANSFLASAIIPVLISTGYQVQGLMRQRAYPKELIEQLRFFSDDISDINLDDIHAVLYFRPDYDEHVIQTIRASNTPICTIGSGAVIDFRQAQQGKPDLEPNSYVTGKLLLVENSDLIIHPGFYIPNASQKDIGRGLHRDTLASLFREDTPPIPEDKMEKAYYMTSVPLLVNLFMKWLADPVSISGEFAFGTPMAISRRELRDNSTPSSDSKYLQEMEKTQRIFGPGYFHTQGVIDRLHQDAKEWITQN